MAEHNINEQKQNMHSFETQNLVAVESSRKKKKCLAAVLVIFVIALIVGVVLPIVLLTNKKDQSSGINNSQLINGSIDTESRPTSEPSGWSDWSICSVTCGNGTRERQRTCTADETACNDEVETSVCVMTSCKAPASWGEWSQWSPCSKTCSVGSHFRSRNCTTTESKCDGDEVQTKNCTLMPVCPAVDCSHWLRMGSKNSGVYTIDPDERGPFSVFCDMTTDGGGWTVFQRRQDGSADFYRNWQDYKTGFGNQSGEFWLGNEYIHRLTSLNTSLYVMIEDWNGVVYNASYYDFYVDSNTTNYKLSVSGYSGTAGDSLSGHNHMMFSTYDRDNDNAIHTDCGSSYNSGWWFNQCITANLNGQYLGNTRGRTGIIWIKLSTLNFQTMKATEMKLRPR